MGNDKGGDRGARTGTPDVTAIVKALRRIVRAIELYSQDVKREYHLTGPQLWALKTLRREGGLTPNQLAAGLAVHQSSVSSLLRRLERRSLIQRRRVAHDRRSVRIHLTPRGAALVAQAPEPAQGRLLHGLNDMSPRRLRSLRQAMESLVSTMEATNLKARFFFSDD